MKTIIFLGLKSLKQRKFVVSLTLLSIALSVALYLGVERVRDGARESFTNTISKTDLIVGARGGSLQLLLYTVFRIGSSTNNISYRSFDKWSKHPAVAWTIPYSLGDSHRGFRVVSTNENFYKHYHYQGDRPVTFSEGVPPSGVFDVALGSEVANILNYKLGQDIIISHGFSEGGVIQSHDNMPFKVTGILKRTSTPIDRSLYITLEGMEAIHIDWSDGSAPQAGQETKPEKIDPAKLKPKVLTAFLLGTKNRIDTLHLQREISDDESEPLLAIIPGVALSELWRGISFGESALKIVSYFVVMVGLIGMLISIYNSLNERRREMAILRAAGAGRKTIYGLLIFESTFLSIAGSLFGIVLIYIILVIAQPLAEKHLGIFVPIKALSMDEFIYLGAVMTAGFILGFIPAWRAYRNSLLDGLSPRV